MASLDGSTFAVYPADDTAGALGPLWFPDGRRWVSVSSHYDRRARRYDLRRATIRTIDDPDAEWQIQLQDCPDAIPLGINADDHLLTYSLNRPRKPESHLLLRRIPLCLANVNPADCEEYEITLPYRGEVSDAALSPHGSSLAWILTQPDRENGPFEVWTSGPEGEDMCLVRAVEPISLPESEDPRATTFDFPRELRWLPSGAAVSYVFQDAIHTVPV